MPRRNVNAIQPAVRLRRAKRPGKLHGPSEHAEATVLMRAVRAAEPCHPELRWFYAIPNGGHRSKAAGAKAKAEGVRRGVSDYCLPVRRAEYSGLYLELKRADEGRPTKEQREFLAFVRGQGYRAEVCHGWEHAWAVVRDFLAMDRPNEDET